MRLHRASFHIHVVYDIPLELRFFRHRYVYRWHDFVTVLQAEFPNLRSWHTRPIVKTLLADARWQISSLRQTHSTPFFHLIRRSTMCTYIKLPVSAAIHVSKSQGLTWRFSLVRSEFFLLRRI